MREIVLTRNKVAIVDDEDYDRVAGFHWRAVKHRHCWYAHRSIKNKGTISMHRELLDAPAGTQVDHRNGNGLDNRRENLRFATPSQNQANRHRLQSNNRSGFRGVFWYKADQRWRAVIRINGKQKHLGTFENIQDAANAYDAAMRNLYGEYAERIKR